MVSVALTIAGSDPSGGAGIQADLKTFHQHGVYGASVVTVLTVQNTRAVGAVRAVEPSFVLGQLEAVLEDIPPVAAKTGALGSAAVIAAIGERAKTFGFPLVVDPVMISKHGHALIKADAVEVIKHELLPHAWLVTPNMHEAAVLAEREVTDLESMGKAAATIALRGVPHVLVKGGRLETHAVDLLYSDGELHQFASPRIDSPHTHGTGCAYSAAITARVARGEALQAAVQGAKAFITHAIRSSPALGGGCGPINLHADVPPLSPATPGA
jgi:hydroxymethylpyrimidine/phosphomethylpyrimidine kinase